VLGREAGHRVDLPHQGRRVARAPGVVEDLRVSLYIVMSTPPVYSSAGAENVGKMIVKL
jgi:hypothetical protein